VQSIANRIVFPLFPIVLAKATFLSPLQGLTLQMASIFHCRSPVFFPVLGLGRRAGVEERDAAKALAVVGEHRDAAREIVDGAGARRRLPRIGDEIGLRDRVLRMDLHMREPRGVRCGERRVQPRSVDWTKIMRKLGETRHGGL